MPGKHIAAHLCTLAAFGMAYSLAFKTNQFHIVAPTDPETDAACFAVSVHTLLGDNSVVPKTRYAKLLVSAHAAIAFCLVVGIILFSLKSRLV